MSSNVDTIYLSAEWTAEVYEEVLTCYRMLGLKILENAEYIEDGSKIIRKYEINSIHDISEGGLMVAISESCFNPNNNIGAKINPKLLGLKNNLALFAESQGCYILSTNKNQAAKIKSYATKNNINVKVIGEVGGDSLILEDTFKIKIDALFKIWNGGFPS